ncbi:Rho GDP-dissociation inhibitor [Heterostelium album PN500]|uniref:Rho GDP-dissociation inhibitor n=1 Tax=Heterostelium pallidum (strain ATCC 26659 / Pp 5 / PN500) TaxID=670386 RepID=D3B2Q2_HETP5|nr:Rho GDP-dissociation inhibitor [Heterostelium album PN500]EFA83600.1 Rho GDP-dissociation inhibitor [Heterostelium album PN500]|eukprot:XP_020435717.1 Rho GDP-dissociation inhibitor [Heterostelium album PN500]
MSDDERVDAPEYKPSKKVTVDELMNQDAEDESLRKYKQALLGSAVAGPKDDPRRVVVQEMIVMFEDRPGGNITYNLETKESIEKMKNTPFVLKEECKYKIRIVFKVQHDIVSGLKYVNTAYRKGIKVATVKNMLGSFGPQAAYHEVTVPRNVWEEAPSGILARGSYTAKITFEDDDGAKHLDIEYGFSIKSDWSKE